jgi:hypothetical protein
LSKTFLHRVLFDGLNYKRALLNRACHLARVRRRTSNPQRSAHRLGPLQIEILLDQAHPLIGFDCQQVVLLEVVREKVHLGFLARAFVQGILEFLGLIVIIIALLSLVFFTARVFLAELRVNDLKLILSFNLNKAPLGPKALEFPWAAPRFGRGEDGKAGCPSVGKPEEALIQIF